MGWRWVLNRNRRVEERITRLAVSDGAGEFQNSNWCFGDIVALHFIVVSLDEDSRLTAIRDAVAIDFGQAVVAC
jgi:hypothetical protein